MSKKKSKGKKVSLGSFFEVYGAPKTDIMDQLPDAPRGVDAWEQERAHRDQARNNRYQDEDQGPSRADESMKWRRDAPAQGPSGGSFRRGPGGGFNSGGGGFNSGGGGFNSGGGGFNSGGFGGGPGPSGGGGGFGSGFGRGGFDNMRGPRGFDDDDQQQNFRRADDANDWRSNKMSAPAPDQPRIGRSDAARSWRGSGQPAQQAVNRPPRQVREDTGDWRSHSVRQVPREPSGFGARRTQRAPGYKPLRLKPKSDQKTDQSGPTSSSTDDNNNNNNNNNDKNDNSSSSQSAAAAAAPSSQPAPRPVIRPKKSKKIDPNVKLDPFGKARPKAADVKIERKAVRDLRRSARAAKSADTTASGPSLAPQGNPSPARFGVKVNRFAANKKASSSASSSSASDQKKKADSAQSEAKDKEEAVTISALVADNALELAVKERTAVTLKQLEDGLSKLDVSTGETASRLGTVLGHSISKKNFDLPKAVDIIKSSKASSKKGKIFTSALEAIKADSDEATLQSTVKDSGVSLKDLAITFTADLICLKSGPDITQLVTEAVSADKSPADILAVINANNDGGKVDTSILLPVIAPHVFAKVYPDKKTADEAVLEEFADVLRAVVRHSRDAGVQLIVKAHETWFAAGAGKARIVSIFKKLVELKIVSAESFVFWKTDIATKKAKGKKKAIIYNVAWLNDLEKSLKPREPESDEDEEDDETTMDEFLVNHNRPTF